MKITLVIIFFINFIIQPAQSIVIKIDDLLEDNLSLNSTIIKQLLNAEELQIGGTQTYGNIISENSKELNSKIIIINPDFEAHSTDKNVLSFQESGFNFKFISKLVEVCRKLNHIFKRIYINNVCEVLPIEDDTIAMYTDHSDESFLRPSSYIIGDCYNVSKNKYYEAITRESLRLYQAYYFLLAENGGFYFKSASRRNLNFIFARSYTDSEKDVEIILENIANCPEKSILFKNNEDIRLIEDLEFKLKEVGDSYLITKASLDLYPENISTEECKLIDIQINLLKKIGFQYIGVEFGCFKNWGYGNLENKKVFSMIIRAYKNNNDLHYQIN